LTTHGSGPDATIHGEAGDRSPVGVSVVIPTYNHAPYIEAAVASVVEQRTAFPVEIVITEDASTDGTRDIVTRIAASMPDRVRLLLSERNLCSNHVIARGLRATVGRYVAVLDGDDRFVDETRLQRQSDFLDRWPDCVAVFGNALLEGDGGPEGRRWTRRDLPARVGPDVLFEGNPFAICAGLFRGAAARSVPDWYDDFTPMLTDWPFYVHCSRLGWFAFLDEPVAVYRQHPGGTFSALSRTQKLDKVEGFYRSIGRVDGGRWAGAARRGASRHFLDWAKAHHTAGRRAEAVDTLRRAVRAGGLLSSGGVRETLRLATRLVLERGGGS
jgi:glycosyltransferase involved in cell wall biosynthesis